MRKSDKVILRAAQDQLYAGQMDEAAVLASQLFQVFLEEKSIYYFPEMGRLFRSLNASDAIVPAIRQLVSEHNLKAFKNRLLEELFALSDPEQKINALLSSLLPDSFIGQILHTPRHFTVSLCRGSLKQVVDELKSLIQDDQLMEYMDEPLQKRFQEYPQLIKQLEEQLFKKNDQAVSNKQTAFFWCSKPPCCPHPWLSVLEHEQPYVNCAEASI